MARWEEMPVEWTRIKVDTYTNQGIGDTSQEGGCESRTDTIELPPPEISFAFAGTYMLV